MYLLIINIYNFKNLKLFPDSLYFPNFEFKEYKEERIFKKGYFQKFLKGCQESLILKKLNSSAEFLRKKNYIYIFCLFRRLFLNRQKNQDSTNTTKSSKKCKNVYYTIFILDSKKPI